MTTHYEIRIGDALKNAWAIFCKGPEVFVTLSFTGFALAWLFNNIPIGGTLGSILLLTISPIAYILAADHGSRHEQISFNALEPIPALIPQMLTLSILKYFLIALGFLCFILPGIYLAVIFAFAEYFVVLEKKTFLEALKASKHLVSQNFWGVLGLLCFLAVLVFSGILLIGLGLLVTIPLAYLVHYSVFQRIYIRVV